MWNKNKVDLMKLLIKNDVTGIEELSNALDLKKRTIYFYVKEINDLLKKYKLNLIKNKWNEGFIFDGDFELIEKLVEKEFYLFSHEERLGYICFDSLINGTKKTLLEYANIFGVSKNTIFLDVQKGPSLMAQYNLKFSFDKEKNVCIDGIEIQKRCFLIHYINDFVLANEEFVVGKLFKVKEIRSSEVINVVRNIVDEFKKLDLYINDKYFKFLISYLSILKIYYRTNPKSSISIPSVIIENVKKTPYWNECNEIFKYFYGDQDLESEKCYLVLLMTSGSISDNGQFSKLVLSNKIENFASKLNEVVETFVNKIEINSLIFFNNKERLIQNIINHILRSYLRIKYVLVSSEYLKVKDEYKFIFNFVKDNISVLEEFLEVKMFNDEIALVSLYFISDLFFNRNSKIKIAVILSPHHNIESLIEKQLLNSFANLEIHNITNLKDFINSKNKYDLVLSAIDLPKNINYLRIGKVLFDNDKKDIRTKIQKILKEKAINNIHYKDMMHLECFNIIEEEIQSFEHAINKSCELLLKEKKIDNKFVTEVINNFNKYNHVHRLSKNALLIYGPFQNKKNKLSYSFNYFKKSSNFYFGKNRIDFVVVLVPIDSDSHLESVKFIKDLVSDTKLAEKVNKCKNVKDFAELILN